MTGRPRCRSPTRSGSSQPRWADEPVSPARYSYLALMDVVAPKVTEHDLLLEVTVAVGRAPPGGPIGAALSAAMTTLCGRAGAVLVPASTPPVCR